MHWVWDMAISSKKRRSIWLLAATIAFPAVTVSASDSRLAPPLSDPNFVYVAERQRFIEARAALASGSTETFEALYASLQGYPLQTYLAYEQLSKKWAMNRPGVEALDELNAFSKQADQIHFSRKLTRKLQRRFADTEQWKTFLAISDLSLAASLPCKELQAKHELGSLKGFDDKSLALWGKPQKHPEACARVLSQLEGNSTVSVVAVWNKIYSAMAADKPEFALPVLKYLATSDRTLVQRWIDSVKNPEAFLLSGELAKDTVLNRRIIADLVVEWSKEDTPAAMNHWLSVRNDYLFYRDRNYDTHRAIAMRSAYRRMPEAYGWLYTFDAKPDDLELQEWRIRTALLAEDWKAVRKSISELPVVEQQEDHWAYWEARALQVLGRPEEAKAIYTNLAQLQSYHGFLSADRLKLEYSLYDDPFIVDRSLLDEISEDPRLVRAREFHFVQLSHESRREWNSWLRGQKPAELAAGAVLASHWSLYDRAIFTAGKTQQKRAISVRFPVLYRSEVAKAAVKNRIDPAWIFGVMRRESAYIRDIKSGAGAIGLMQLMPNTAKYVAKLQGDKNWRGDLTNASTNINFGAFYMRHVMDKFDDHQVLATASYNAGPRRINNWLEDRSLEADIWIDTIPFTETRRYVRAVLAYAAIYEYHLTGKPVPISNKLRPVPAAPEV
ncbi:MAG: soluble lytic murein transglycosylase [Granulosicoccus sp.]|jgi:soluble lytic murein transglycosylase